MDGWMDSLTLKSLNQCGVFILFVNELLKDEMKI